MGRLTGAAALLSAGILAACGSAEPPAGPETATVTASTTSTTAASAAPATTTTAAPGPETSNGQRYTVTSATIEGDADDGRGSWKSEFHEIAGGDPAVVEAFNHASRTAATEQVDGAKDAVTDGTTPWSFEATSEITFRPIAVAQIIYGSLSYGAHPSHQLATIVIDSRSTDPVMLVDLFADPQAALNVIAGQTRATLAADGLEIAPDEPGAAPRAENFANWIPTADGLEFHFNEYQFGPRLPAVVTVPWTAVGSLLTPQMAELATG